MANDDRGAGTSLVVFVTYPAAEGARDFVDESLIEYFDSTPIGEVSGGGTFLSQNKATLSCTDVDLFPPTDTAYHQLVRKLKDMDMPPETVLRSEYGIIPLYEIDLPE